MQTLTLIRVGTFAVALAAATWFGGWWTVPLMGSVHAFTARGATRPGLEAAIGAMLIMAALVALTRQFTAPAPLGADRGAERTKALAELRGELPSPSTEELLQASFAKRSESIPAVQKVPAARVAPLDGGASAPKVVPAAPLIPPPAEKIAFCNPPMNETATPSLFL
jgi:hypothetical protein